MEPGYGTGRILIRLAEQKAEVVGLDASHRAINLARWLTII